MKYEVPHTKRWLLLGLITGVACVACSKNEETQKESSGSKAANTDPSQGGAPSLGGTLGASAPPAAACNVGKTPTASVSQPQLAASLQDSWHEAWLASPAIADLDGDGTSEIIAPRGSLLNIWHADGTLLFSHSTGDGRIWSSPVVAELVPDLPGLEVAVASRGEIYVWDARGKPVEGFPVQAKDELRSLAAADIDGDGLLELVTVSNQRIEGNSQRDIIYAFNHDGSKVAGFPPNTTGNSGCGEWCSVTGGYDQNLALGDLNGDGIADIFATQDNSHNSLHDGTGRAFPLSSQFERGAVFPAMRFLHDWDLALQGWAEDEETANQAHSTNSAPAIADVDGDGKNEIILLASVQNAAQTDRLRGVALWVLRPDGTRPKNWEKPLHFPNYLAGLWDFEGTNMVAATNQVSVADMDPSREGLEFVFAGFDGQIHSVDAQANELWSYTYTTSDKVLTTGVALADLNGDGSPEVVFTSYSPEQESSHLFVLDAGGNELHKLALPGRGAMPVPTIADANDNGVLDIVVSLKDSEKGKPQVQIFEVPGSESNCLLWATGRGNLLRNGWIIED